MHDILDDNLNLTSTPSMLGNSRSGSMKKLTKKQTSKPPIYQHPKANQNKTKDFDLIDEFLSKQSRPNNQFNEGGSVAASQKNKFESIDLNFEDSIKSKPLYSKDSTPTNNFARTSIFKNGSHDDILGEDHNFNYQFGKTELTIFNPSKIEESFVSTRNMKPPIKRKESHANQSLNFEVTIPEEDITVNSSNNKYEDQVRPSPRINRRSSIDTRSDNNDESFTLNRLQSPSSAFHFDHIKEVSSPNSNKKQTSTFIKDPKSQNADNPVGPFFKSKQKGQQNTQTSKDFQQKLDKQNKSLIQDYERQIDMIKKSHQKQIQYLQQTLDRQIKENRELREKFMNETSRIIQEERNRTNKMHHEEIERLKEMFIWQKKRMEETYKNEIQSLRQTLDYANQNGPISAKNNVQNSISKQSLQFLEYQLKSKQKMIEEKQKMLDQRQQDIQKIQSDLNKRRKRQEDRIREEQKRIMDLELNYKKLVLSEKKDLSEEKQQMAIEIGNMEMEIIKMKQTAELSLKQNQLQRESLDNERQELRRINGQMMDRYKASLEELQLQKQKIKEIQIQLIKKLRIIEMKAKEAMHCTSNQQGASIDYKKINACLQDHAMKRPASSQKSSINTKSMTNINRTKERFYHLQKNSRSKLNLSIKQNKKLDLGGYMTRVEQFSKLKSQF